MQVVNLTKRQFEKLEPLNLESNIFNTEAQMFMLPQKKGWHEEMAVLKRYYTNFGEVFSNKHLK